MIHGVFQYCCRSLGYSGNVGIAQIHWNQYPVCETGRHCVGHGRRNFPHHGVGCSDAEGSHDDIRCAAGYDHGVFTCCQLIRTAGCKHVLGGYAVRADSSDHRLGTGLADTFHEFSSQSAALTVNYKDIQFQSPLPE